MSGNVVQLQRLFRRSCDWSSRELAEFYRVEAALVQAGLRIETERGLSDEGDPWFAFCRPDEGEVIVHIARIGDLYVLASPSYDGIASGNDITELVRDLAEPPSVDSDARQQKWSGLQDFSASRGDFGCSRRYGVL